MKRTASQKGITLIEVMVGISILAVSLVFIGYTITLYVTVRDEMLADAQAVYLAEEGYELVRLIRNDDWNTLEALAVDTPHALSVTTTTVSVAAPPEIIDGKFVRTFELRELYRDGDDDVVASTTAGSTTDEEGRELWVRVGSEYGTTTMRAIITNVFVE